MLCPRSATIKVKALSRGSFSTFVVGAFAHLEVASLIWKHGVCLPVIFNIPMNRFEFNWRVCKIAKSTSGLAQVSGWWIRWERALSYESLMREGNPNLKNPRHCFIKILSHYSAFLLRVWRLIREVTVAGRLRASSISLTASTRGSVELWMFWLELSSPQRARVKYLWCCSWVSSWWVRILSRRWNRQKCRAVKTAR